MYYGIRKNSKNYKAKRIQLSNKSVKELKVKTPEAFVYSNTMGNHTPNHQGLTSATFFF